MKEKPMLFSGAMIRALLDKRKTQTRRVVNPQPPTGCHFVMNDAGNRACCLVTEAWDSGDYDRAFMPVRPGYASHTLDCPHGVRGDELWVRECHSLGRNICGMDAWYWADGNPAYGDWTRPRPSIHMPRWASRIRLRLTDVRIERVQDISEEDAIAEGIIDGGCLNCGQSEPCACDDPHPDARDAFCYLWNSINAKRGFDWAVNPWVWALTFEVVGVKR